MLQAGHTDSEEVRLKKAVSEVLRPDSAMRVQEWLKSASESGKPSYDEDIIYSQAFLVL